MKSKVSLFLFMLFLLGAFSSARADDEYTTPSLRSLVMTLVRFGALDLRRDDIIDDYGRIVECKIYQKYYSNDFEWQKVRAALRESIKQNIATFPTSYKFDTVLQLDRYDFKDNLYRFTDKTAQASSNVFSVKARDEETCTFQYSYQHFPPMIYKFVLDRPLKLQGIPIGAKDGELLLQRMLDAKNEDRLIYARFNLRVSYIAPIVPKDRDQRSAAKKALGPMVTQEVTDDDVSMDSRVDSIEYYEDKDRTKLIYSFTP